MSDFTSMSDILNFFLCPSIFLEELHIGSISNKISLSRNYFSNVTYYI